MKTMRMRVVGGPGRTGYFQPEQRHSQPVGQVCHHIIVEEFATIVPPFPVGSEVGGRPRHLREGGGL